MPQRKNLEDLLGTFAPPGVMVAIFNTAEECEQARRSLADAGLRDARVLDNRDLAVEREQGATKPGNEPSYDVAWRTTRDQYIEAARDGEHILRVQLTNEDQVEDVRERLLDQHAHFIRFHQS